MKNKIHVFFILKFNLVLQYYNDKCLNEYFH
jgi:hypothetical protein